MTGRRLVLALVFLALGGCSGASSYLEGPESALGLTGDARTFHWAVLDPVGVRLQFPGYLVGIEKSPQDVVAGPGSSCPPSPAAVAIEGWKQTALGLADNEGISASSALHRVQTQPKVVFLSHWIEFTDDTVAKRQSGLVRYSVFQDRNQETAPCAQGLFDKGWDEVDKLAAQVAERVSREGISHVFLYSMGWNTDQEEAVRNFNALFGNLLDQAKAPANRPFKPLFIGMTWPSKWPGIFHDLDYFNKAHDADEYGAVWGRRMVSDVGGAAKAACAKTPGCDVKLVVVGHSFGARAMSQAVFSPGAPKVADLLLLLQPAFSKNRFLPARSWEDAPYRHPQDHVGKVVMTASDTDKANPLAFWSEHGGGELARWDACALDRDLFDCRAVDQDGKVDLSVASPPRKVMYLDASQLVKYQMIGTGGGSHSDIYRPPVGRLSWDLIRQYAP
jgi:hypothetical protein